MPQEVLLFLAFLIVLCVPSANFHLFDGLPISRLPEFAALVATAPFLLFSELRSRQKALREQWKIRPVYLWILLAVVLLVKCGLFVSGEESDFSGCYRSSAEPTIITHEDLPARDCERSYENLFGREEATRNDPTIRFGPDVWNLVFLNTNRYNYYDWEEGNILRTRIPVEVHWSGYPDVEEGDSIRIEYAGEGSVVWGNVRVALPPSYEKSNAVEVDPPGEESLLEIDYSFDDGSRSGQDSQAWGPKATIKVTSGKPGRMTPLAAKPAGIGFQLPALLADALILLWIIFCLPALWHFVRHDLRLLIAFFIGIGIFSLIPVAPVFRGIGITCVLAVALVAHIAFRPLRTVTIYVLVMAAGFAILRVWTSGYGLVLLRSAGNDALSYESQAYSILATGSLRGGESVFEYIPAYRYIKYLEHALFGDGDMLYASVQLAAFFGGVFGLFHGLRDRAVPLLRRMLLVGLGSGLIFLGGYYVSGIIREGLSEYSTWIILLWALPALQPMANAGAILAGMIALSVSYTIRPNQVLGILWILFLTAVGSWKKHAKPVLFAGVLALGIALLPLVHNVTFGGQWVLTATSGGMAVNLVLLPSTWLAFLQGDPTAAEAVREQMGMLFLITDAPRSMLPTLAVMALFLACWLAVAGAAIVRRKAPDLPWLAVPVFFLGVHLLYGVSTYYPRHIITAYLSMAIVAVLALIRGLRNDPSAAGPAVELPRK